MCLLRAAKGGAGDGGVSKVLWQRVSETPNSALGMESLRLLSSLLELREETFYSSLSSMVTPLGGGGDCGAGGVGAGLVDAEKLEAALAFPPELAPQTPETPAEEQVSVMEAYWIITEFRAAEWPLATKTTTTAHPTVEAMPVADSSSSSSSSSSSGGGGGGGGGNILEALLKVLDNLFVNSIETNFATLACLRAIASCPAPPLQHFAFGNLALAAASSKGETTISPNPTSRTLVDVVAQLGRQVAELLHKDPLLKENLVSVEEYLNGRVAAAVETPRGARAGDEDGEAAGGLTAAPMIAAPVIGRLSPLSVRDDVDDEGGNVSVCCRRRRAAAAASITTPTAVMLLPPAILVLLLLLLSRHLILVYN